METMEIGANTVNKTVPLASVIPLPRHPSEELGTESFLAAEPETPAVTPLPYFNLVVEKQKLAEPKTILGNCEVETRRFRLSDGKRYNAKIYTPDRPRYNAPVTFATPWCTDLEGFNDDHLGQELAANGFYVIGVSPEQSGLHGAIKKVLANALAPEPRELAHDAEAHHLILDRLTDDGRIDSDSSFNVGYSRGAMIGLGLQAYAKRHGREFAYSDYTDPCLEHAIDLRKVRYNELPSYFKKELGALGLALADEHDLHLTHLLKTIRLSAAFWVSQIATGIDLFRGEAGSFVDHLPKDSNTHVTLYHGSIFNHAESWQQGLAPFPNIEIANEEGCHASGANRSVSCSTIGRLVNQADALAA